MTTSRRFLHLFAFLVTKFFHDLFPASSTITTTTTSRTTSSSLFAAASSSSSSSRSNYRNVYGKELKPCSYNGTALTGYTRSGYCVETYDDSGSHHICLNLQSNSNNTSSSGGSGSDFCEVTGQSDWCNSDEMPCHEDSNNATCSIQNWCVCQWAFASYLRKVGGGDGSTGCDAIQDLDCEATNMEAMRAYQSTKGYEAAFGCLMERCGINPNTNFRKPRSVAAWTLYASASLFVAILTTIVTLVYQSRQRKEWIKTHSRSNSRTIATMTIDNTDIMALHAPNKAALLSTPERQNNEAAAGAEILGEGILA